MTNRDDERAARRPGWWVLPLCLIGPFVALGLVWAVWWLVEVVR